MQFHHINPYILSSYFLFCDESDPSINYNDPEYQSIPMSVYISNSVKFIKSIYYLMDNLNDDLSEPELTILVYNSAKLYDENNVREFFKKIYQLISRTTNGPRLPTFIYLLGPTRFKSMIENKLKNPLEINMV